MINQHFNTNRLALTDFEGPKAHVIRERRGVSLRRKMKTMHIKLGSGPGRALASKDSQRQLHEGHNESTPGYKNQIPGWQSGSSKCEAQNK
jgi:hypothetical protein